ncbi:glycosyltransferase [Jatrophihabitans sp. YIM 134969]
MTPRRVGVLSLEPWDDVWRRNQHLVAALLATGLVGDVVFVEPPAARRPRRFRPRPGVEVVRPPLLLPRRLGGLRFAALLLRSGPLRRAELLWVNDAPLGVHLLRGRRPVVYDVTDDWRTATMDPRPLARLVAAEDELTRRATVVVCSDELRERWRQRYGTSPAVVRNGVDVEAYRTARPRPLTGPGPHVGYVGSLHGDRLDVELVQALAARVAPGTVHLVGPDHFSTEDRNRLEATDGVVLEGAVPARDVPGWTLGMDVLICPHRITPFTRSLDAIKAHEYLASGRPVVATATSGFDRLDPRPGLWVGTPEGFVEAVVAAVDAPVAGEVGPPPAWTDRAREFARAWPVTT